MFELALIIMLTFAYVDEPPCYDKHWNEVECKEDVEVEITKI